MELPYKGIGLQIVEILKRFKLQDGFCECQGVASYLFSVAELGVCTSSEMTIKASIQTHLQAFRPDSFGCHSLGCQCNHEMRRKEVTMSFSLEQWESTFQDISGIFVVVGARVSKDHVSANHVEAAVFRWDHEHGDDETKSVRVGEMFCGGIGGWSQACRALASSSRDISTCWAVDIDPITCRTFARSHDMTYVVNDASDCWNQVNSDEESCQVPSVVFNTDVKRLWWIVYAAREKVQLVCASPPCPPWSLANEATGLNTQAGMMMIWAILICGVLRPRIWMLENVANLLTHPHWKLVREVIAWTGYKIEWCTVLNLSDQAPQNRDRALIIAVDCHDKSRFNHTPVKWPCIRPPTLRSYGVIREMEELWMMRAVLSNEHMEMYMNPSLLPKSSPYSHQKKSKRDVAEYRLRDADSCFGCIMTSYGNPDAVRDEHLYKNGLYGTLYCEGNIVRKLCVPELLVLMGTLEDVWLPESDCVAVGMIGNSISPLHALITIINGLCYVRPLWVPNGVQSLFADIAGLHITSDMMIVTDAHGGFWFTRRSTLYGDVARTLPTRAIHSLKIISPTQEYELQVETGILLKVMMQLIAGKASPPQFQITILGSSRSKYLAADSMIMPSSALTMNSLTPSFMWPNEISMCLSDWPCILLLTPKVTFVLRRDEGITPEDIDMIMNGHGEDDIVEGCCKDLFMRTCPLQVNCPNITLYVPEPEANELKPPASLRFRQEGQAILATMNDDTKWDFLHFMRQSRLMDVCLALGWGFSEVIHLEPTRSNLILHTIKLSRIEGRFAVQADHVISVIKVLLFIRSMNQLPVPVKNVARLKIKIWESWTWVGWIDTDLQIVTLDQAWADACRFFSHDEGCRWICHGKRINPEFKFGDYIELHSNREQTIEFPVHLVLPLQGGGPPRQVLPNTSNMSLISDDDADDSPRSRTPVQPVYPVDASHRDVRDDVEQVVANFLERLVQHPTSDRFLSEEVYQGLMIIEEIDQMSMHGSIAQVIRVMEFCQRSGIETMLHEMGWQLVMRIPDFDNPQRVLLLFHPIAGARTQSISTMRGFVVSAFTYCRMPFPGPGTGNAVHVRVNLWGVVVVDGFFDPDMAMGRFSQPWYDASSFLGQPSQMRLIANGRQLNPDFPISTYARTESDGVPTLKVHMVYQLSGGGPPGAKPKPDAVVKAKSELAKLFLDLGCDLQSTMQAVDQLIKRGGLTAVNAALRKRDPANKLESLTELAASLDVKISDHNHAALQRQNANKKRLNNLQKQHQITPCASAYKIKSGFFQNEDGSEATVLASLQHSACGVFLCDASKADPWLDCADTISQDELALVILGGCKDVATGKCKAVTIPATDSSDYPVLLSCCVHQMGRKTVQIQKPAGAQVQVEPSVICSLTIFQDELSEDNWQLVQKQPSRAVIELMQKAGVGNQIINSPWGKSWWGKAGTTIAAHATSLQLHARIPTSARDDTMRASGMTGVYINPKNDKGAIDTSFAVVWVDAPLSEIQVKAAAIAESLGLVRIARSKQQKTSRGIRVNASNYEKVFKLLKPNIEVPRHICVEHIAKLTPTPEGATADTIKQWISQMQMTARPIKPLGQRTWLLGFTEKTDKQWFLFNDQYMMLQFLPDRNEAKQTPIVVSAAPKSASSTNGASVNAADDDDPWAAYRKNNGIEPPSVSNKSPVQGASMPAPRVIQGPIEDRFQQQDKAIENMQQAIQSLQQQTEEQTKSQGAFQQAVEGKFKDIQHDMEKHIQMVGKQFEDSMNRAMQKQDSQLNSCFSDLKQMIQDVNKKPTKKRNGPPTEPNRGPNAMQDDEQPNSDGL
eukprot:Skav209238  [mRNA]  locus=scaffold293:433722:439145:+ [translate_table: standard]